MQNKGLGVRSGVGQGGCEPRIEFIVQMHKSRGSCQGGLVVGFRFQSRGVGVDLNQELKVL